MTNFEEALELHKKHRGKIEVTSKIEVNSREILSLVYSPGVAEPCKAIAADPESAYAYTTKGNMVAVISDGSAVLGLGNIGALAAIPVMEGKAMLFKKFGGIDAFPICLDTQNADEIVATIRRIAPVFGGINLEDISAPRSFEVEEQLQDLGIPVFHDDQHGTAIVVLGGLINAAKVVKKDINSLKVVLLGAGAAGVAIAKLLKGIDQKNSPICVKDVILCDRTGILHQSRPALNDSKKALLEFTNKEGLSGKIQTALKGADVFIGVSEGKQLEVSDIRLMAKDAIVFALANPEPEILPELAFEGGAAVVGTGRSDYPNQVNNVLGFPGVFRGALDARAKTISPAMKLAAAFAIASCVENPRPDFVIPDSLDVSVAKKVAAAVFAVAIEEKKQS